MIYKPITHRFEKKILKIINFKKISKIRIQHKTKNSQSKNKSKVMGMNTVDSPNNYISSIQNQDNISPECIMQKLHTSSTMSKIFMIIVINKSK